MIHFLLKTSFHGFSDKVIQQNQLFSAGRIFDIEHVVLIGPLSILEPVIFMKSMKINANEYY